jgi:hypothetical protein
MQHLFTLTFKTRVILHDIMKKGTMISFEAYVTMLQRFKNHKCQVQPEKITEDALFVHLRLNAHQSANEGYYHKTALDPVVPSTIQSTSCLVRLPSRRSTDECHS